MEARPVAAIYAASLIKLQKSALHCGWASSKVTCCQLNKALLKMVSRV
jgi:hypothetical protein